VAYDLSEPKGADIVGWSASPETAWWRSHPDVIDVLSIPRTGADGEPRFEVHFWLRPAPEEGAEPTWERTPRPDREPDLDLFVGDQLHPTFAGRWPPAEHVEVFVEADGEEYFPCGWWAAHIWLLERASQSGQALP
jgi:hypothetical protein